MLGLATLSTRVKNTFSTFLPALWYAVPEQSSQQTSSTDVEKAQPLLNDESAIFPIRQVEAELRSLDNSSNLLFSYKHHGEKKTFVVVDEVALDQKLEQIKDIDQWVINSFASLSSSPPSSCGLTVGSSSVATGSASSTLDPAVKPRDDNYALWNDRHVVFYKYRNKYDEIKTANSETELDLQVAKAIPSSYNAWVINDVSQARKTKTHVMKQYNWFWSVLGAKRYSENQSREFHKEVVQLDKSWSNTKLFLGAGLSTAVVGVGAYAAYRALQNEVKDHVVPVGVMDVVAGSEFQVNTYTTNGQWWPATTALINGNFLVLWESNGQDGDNYGIYGQLYNNVGTIYGSEFQVNTYTTNAQEHPSATMLTNSDFIIVWDSYGQDGSEGGIFAQRYGSSGNIQGSEFQVNTYTSNAQYFPSIAPLTNGGFVVVWGSFLQDGSGAGVYAQRYDSVGTPQNSEFQVNTYTTNNQDRPSIAALSNGGFIVAWSSLEQDGSGDGVYAQRYDGSGIAINSEFRVNTYTAADQFQSSVAVLKSGDFVVVWRGYNNNADIYGQLYDSSGVSIGYEFQVNTYSTDIQSYPRVTALTNAGFVVVWNSNLQDGSNFGVYAQRFDNATNTVDSEFLVNTYITNLQYLQACAGLQTGSFIVTWASYGQDGSNEGVFGKLYRFSPKLDGNTSILSYIEKATPIAVNSNISIIDAYSGLQSGTITLTTNFNPNQDILEFVNQNNITGTYNPSTGILDLSGTASGTDYQTALRSITYSTNDNPGSLTRTIAFKVNDGTYDSNIVTRDINVTPVNDIPVLGNNSLTINEGQTKTLTAADLSATDVDNNNANLSFTVSSVQQGQFELSSNPGVAITSFTQQQITDTLVRFVHNGGETAPSYFVTVGDGSLTTTPASASISFTNVNDAPVLGNNSLTIDEGEIKILTPSDISATDVDTDPSTLTLIVSNIQNGQFEINNDPYPGVIVTSFTQQEISDGNIQFVHDGGEATPSYDVSVNDGDLSTSPAAASITFTNVNDAPQIVDNDLGILEGDTVIIDSSELSASDVDTNPATLTFTVDTAQQGQFELVSNPGTPITSFSQQQITNSAIQFIHDGGELAPSISIHVDDGQLSSSTASANITFTNVNDIPALGNNNLITDEGETVVISGTNFNATDIDDLDSSLTFTVSNIQHGQFELVSNPNVAITSFTQQQVTDSDVQFVHNGGEVAPSVDLSVDDGDLSTDPAGTIIQFTNVNDAPVLVTNKLTVLQGQTVLLSSADLQASDVDNNPNTLIFTVSNILHGQFEFVSNPGVAITSFTQLDVSNGDVQFVHDNSLNSPSFDVSVSDGSLSTTPAAATVNFNAPVLINNNLTLDEGETVILTSSHLNATDIDSNDADLMFAMSNIQQGQFELLVDPGVPITGFTQQEVIDGDVQFVHDGGEIAPSYDTSVSDISISTSPVSASISFTNVNDAPILGNNHLAVTNASSKIFTNAMLSASDVDNNPANLIFTVSNIQNGQFELIGDPGIAITSFTQQQIVDSEVQFIHAGNSLAPAYDVSVSDGSLSTTPMAASINFNTPILGNNSLTLDEGDTIGLSSANLSATDVESSASALVFTVSNVQQGQFEAVSDPGVAITSFTQQQVSDSEIQFVHNDEEIGPSYLVSVSDGELSTTPASANINFTPISDTPILGNNSLTINEGQTKILTGSDLSASDVDNTAGSLTFTVSSVQQGQFEFTSAPGTPITSFTQQQVSDGSVHFVHNGGEVGPSYAVSVGDGTSSTSPVAAAITFSNVNDVPVLGNNSLTISEGQTKVLSVSDFSATDVDDNDATLIFTVSSVQQGRFEFSSNPGVPITSFTQQQIIDSTVRFVHNGSEAAPSYSVSVSDGNLSTVSASASITFTNLNDAPVLDNNALTLNEGEIKVLTSAHMSASDVDNVAGTLTFTVSSIQYGQFELISNPGSAITTFTQQKIIDGEVWFVHNGGETQPSYQTRVDDGSLNTSPSSASITFTNVNDAPVLGNNGMTLSEGETKALTGSILSASDVDHAANSLQFTVSSVEHGQFELVTASGTAITSFTQQQISSNQVQFVHDGSEEAPSYRVRVSDGSLNTTPVNANINFSNVNDAPTIVESIPKQRLLAKDAFTLDVKPYFNDVDTTTLTYSATLENGDALPSWLSFDTATGIFSGSTEERSELQIAVKADDGQYSSEPNVFSLQTAAINWLKVAAISGASVVSAGALGAAGFFLTKNLKKPLAEIRDKRVEKQAIKRKEKLLREFFDTIVEGNEKEAQAYLLEEVAQQQFTLDDSLRPDSHTALHYAVAHRWLAIIKMLMDAGANPSIKNANGKSALDLAQEKGYQDIARVLQKLPPLTESVGSSSSQGSSGSSQSVTPTFSGGGLMIPYESITLGNEIGSGGYGVVYKAKYLGTEVAIKQLTRLTDTATAELRTEAQVMSQLRHPHIVQLIGMSVNPAGAYSLVMEFIPNGSLYQLLHNGKPLAWDIRYQIAMDITSGLASLHEQNIIHRDLKSLNVLLGYNLRAKLADFGLATVKQEVRSKTAIGQEKVKGTAAWLAPELLSRRGRYTKESDVYSYGIVLWELASRQTPFKDAPSNEVLMQWIKDGEQEDIPNTCSPRYAELVKWCWKKSDERPSTNQAIHFLEQHEKAIKTEGKEEASSSDPEKYEGNVNTQLTL